jgi:conjugative transfer pilus assembly protein TraH
MLDVQAAFSGSQSVLDIQDYADVIATDILFQYLDESLSVITRSSAGLPYPADMMAQFTQGIHQARQSVQQTEASAYAQVNMTAQLIQKSQSLEQMLAGSLSAQLNNNLAWASNVR